MYRQTIEAINEKQVGRLIEFSLKNLKPRLPEGKPSTKVDGLYWLYTNYSLKELADARKDDRAGSIDIGLVTRTHQGLENVCSLTVNGFRVVYNGVGGLGPKGHGGLRERILGEFRGGSGTGSLAILGTSLNDLNRWRVSFVLWDELNVEPRPKYAETSTHLERAWRLHYGWPVLCSH